MMKPLNVYVHIPFCKRKCHYCAFYSIPASSALHKAYIGRLILDIGTFTRQCAYTCRTLYLGGGTPSLLPTPLIRQVVEAVCGRSRLPPKEVTIEVNPETVQQSKLRLYREMGINRLSLGLQATQNRLLHLMRRRHTYEDFLQCYKEARKIGWGNINVDLIFGLPTQTLSDWEETLQRVVALRPNHISAYSLELDNDSRWGMMAKHHHLIPADDDLNREMYSLARKRLKAAGYHHYEISNWALPHFACLHNLDFWLGKPYQGFGSGAYSFDGEQFMRHTANVHSYLLQRNTLEREEGGDKKMRWLWLRLRLIKGACKQEYKKTFDSSLEQDWGEAMVLLINQGFLKQTTTHVALTPLGYDVFDGVIEKLWSVLPGKR